MMVTTMLFQFMCLFIKMQCFRTRTGRLPRHSSYNSAAGRMAHRISLMLQIRVCEREVGSLFGASWLAFGDWQIATLAGRLPRSSSVSVPGRHCSLTANLTTVLSLMSCRLLQASCSRLRLLVCLSRYFLPLRCCLHDQLGIKPTVLFLCSYS